MDISVQQDSCKPIKLSSIPISHLLWADDLLILSETPEGLQKCLDILHAYPQMTSSQRIGVVEINTLWLFRYLQLAKKRTKVVSFHRLSGTGMTPPPIHLSPLLKCLMTVCPSSLHSCVQGTNFSPIRTPWLNNVIWRVTSKLFRFR